MSDKAVKWSTVYGAKQAEVYDSVGDAVRAAISASDAGAESLDVIEAADGELIGVNHPLFVRIEAEIDAEWKALSPDPAKLTHYVEAKHPYAVGWVCVRSLTTQRHAEKVARDLAAAIGEDRVDVRHRDQPRRSR